jgi:hypothetical protein
MNRQTTDRILIASILTAISLMFSASNALAALGDMQVTGTDLEAADPYSPYVGRAYPDQVFFGDTHLHTNLSPDAGLIGTTLTPADSYRFARGETVISSSGQPVQLIRPLDFLVVTDHAEYAGLAPMIRDSDPALLASEYGRFLYDKFKSGPAGAMEAFGAILSDAATKNERLLFPEKARSIWEDFLATSDEFNQPGTFTAFSGFEWTSGPNGNNQHRVVIFRDNADRVSQVMPFKVFDSEDPEDLWQYLAGYEGMTGGNAIAIPHNGNISNGTMFTKKRFNGKGMTKEYARERLRWEPIIEVSQIKGDGETHPLLSPEDEFADFGTWDVSNLDGSAPKTDDMLQYEYGRSALKIGLELGKELGVNPYQFGLSAATDSHTGLATAREDNYFGKYAKTEPKGGDSRHNYDVIPATDEALRIFTSQEVASGYTAAWARENTREAIFDAMERKEVYATTGSRMRVRVFGGWNYSADQVTRPDFVRHGYLNGVPMGGELRSAPRGKAPGFLVRALRDPDGANLDRVQVIKGWLDKKGNAQERIYDIAVSGGRKIGSNGRAREAVGNTVDVENATYTNTIGESILSAYWQDPDFDPAQSAFYYVRVLEIPVPRWTTIDAAFYGIKRPTNVPATIQDRAYTSPIWYTP